MPFPMRIQPLDPSSASKGSIRNDPPKQVVKSRFKRLFERQFSSVMRISSADKHAGGSGEQYCTKDEFDPSSVCLDKMIESFIEDSNEKQTKCGRSRCNCFNGNDSSEDDFDFSDGKADGQAGDACEMLTSLVSCGGVSERNLLADTAKIVETNKICKQEEDCKRIVTEGLVSLGYDASICRSRWEKSPSFPAGEYEYIDVRTEGERLIIDIDFKSEFEIARSTKHYRAILQSLPSIFVGKPDRLKQIVAVVSEAARHSLKKKGLHVPPWRKPDYIQAKWLSPYTRVSDAAGCGSSPSPPIEAEKSPDDSQLIFREKEVSEGDGSGNGKVMGVGSPWQPPAVKPRVSRAKIVAGLSTALSKNM